MSSSSLGNSISQQDSSRQQNDKKRGARQTKEPSKKFSNKFNSRTQKLYELSNSCSALPNLARRDSDTSVISVDGLSQSLSCSGVTNNNTQQYRRRKKKNIERERVKPMEIDVKQYGNAASKVIYSELLDNQPALKAFDILLATLRVHRYNLWTAETEEVGDSPLRMLISNQLLMTSRKLSEKYLTQSGNAPVDRKLDEYKLQVLLYIFATLPEQEKNESVDDEKLTEIVAILRMISAAADALCMQDFLNNDVLESFVDRLPRHLTRIFEELYQPVPPELSAFASHDSEDGEFDGNFLVSPKFKATASQPEGRKPISRRASFFNGPTNHKVIKVSESGAKELKVKGEKKERTKKEPTGRTVRKSLTMTFDSLPKHQTPKKRSLPTPSVVTPASTTPKRTRTSTALVEETPIHKQRPLSEYRREKFQRMSSTTMRQVVAETPQKPSSSFAIGTRKSPRIASTRSQLASSLAALTQLDEENADGAAAPPLAPPSKPTVTFTISPIKPRPSPIKGQNGRCHNLFQEFLGHKSPRKRMGKVVRSLLSPRSKPSMIASQDSDHGPIDFSFIMRPN